MTVRSDLAPGGPGPAHSLGRPAAVVIAAVVLLAAVSTMAVWRVAVDERLDALREARYRFALGGVRAALESGLRLGFAPSDVPGAQGLLDQAQARQPDVRSIEVFDASGRILFSTDAAESGAVVPRAVRDACLGGAGPVAADDGDARVQCAPLVNAFDQAAAGVLLRHRTWREERLLRGTGVVSPDVVGAALLLAALGGLLAWLVARGRERPLRAAATAVGQGGPVPDVPLAGPMAAGLASLDAMSVALERAEAEADRIDRMEAH